MKPQLGAVLILMQFLTGKIDWFCWSLHIIFFSFRGFYVEPSGSEFEEEPKCFKASIEFAHFTGTRQQCVGYIIWLCLFLTCADLSKGRMFELCESYPRNHTPNHTPKNTIMNVSFGNVWDCIGLTSFNGPDTLIDQCWPDPMIPGYLRIPARHEWWIFSTRTESHHYP